MREERHKCAKGVEVTCAKAGQPGPLVCICAEECCCWFHMCVVGDRSVIFTLVGEREPTASSLDVLLSCQTISPKLNSLASFSNGLLSVWARNFDRFLNPLSPYCFQRHILLILPIYTSLLSLLSFPFPVVVLVKSILT